MGDTTLVVLAALLRFLGVEPQPKKVWYEGGFSKLFQLLGIMFNLESSPMTASVPEDKVVKTLAALDQVLSEVWSTAELCMSLLGLLVFNSRVLVSGKWHLPHTVSHTAEAVKSGVVFVSRSWKQELSWWRELLTGWNRIALLVPHRYLDWRQEPLLVPMTDASRSLQRLTGAGGAMFGNFFQQWSFTATEIRTLNIMELEALVLVVWLRYLWDTHPQMLAGRRFVMLCDNKPFVGSVNSRHSNVATIAFLLGEIHRMSADLSFDLTLVYVESKKNVGADALSRYRRDLYYKYMRDRFDIEQSALVCVPLQTDYRNSLVSTMLALRT